MTVSLFGHRKLYGQNKEVASRLSTCIDELIKNGATEFFLGDYGELDQLAASVLNKKKVDDPQIRMVLVLPYLDKKIDTKIRYDEFIYPPLEKTPKRYAIVKRNEWMVCNSDAVVVYCMNSYGGAFAALQYAEKQGKRIFRI